MECRQQSRTSDDKVPYIHRRTARVRFAPGVGRTRRAASTLKVCSHYALGRWAHQSSTPDAVDEVSPRCVYSISSALSSVAIHGLLFFMVVGTSTVTTRILPLVVSSTKKAGTRPGANLYRDPSPFLQQSTSQTTATSHFAFL